MDGQPSARFEAAQKQLQGGVEALIDRFSGQSLPLQKKSVECSLRCFDSHGISGDASSFTASSIADTSAFTGKGPGPGISAAQKVGKCIQQCQKPFEELSKITNQEFGNLQGSVQQCQQACVSKAQVKLGGAGSPDANDPAKMGVMRNEMESCSATCMEEGFSNLSALEGRLKGYLGGM